MVFTQTAIVQIGGAPRRLKGVVILVANHLLLNWLTGQYSGRRIGHAINAG